LDPLWLVSTENRSYLRERERPDKAMKPTIAFGVCCLSARCSAPRHRQGVGNQEMKK
jgi:hypothetical protein